MDASPSNDAIRIFTVLLPVWLSMACWFAGLSFRISRRGDLYAGCWLIGAIFMIVHILGSYGVVHQWSHAAAIEATRVDSLRTTGIEAGWGVYVNLVFTTVWMAFSLVKLMRCKVGEFVERLVIGFGGLLVFSATVVFETGWIRWTSLLGFAVLLLQQVASRHKLGKNLRKHAR